MRSKQFKVEILLGVTFLMVLVGATGMLVKPKLEPDRTIKARLGDVDWNHELHARMKEISNCNVCHHKDKQGVTTPKKACKECHKDVSNQEALILADLFVKMEEKSASEENGPPAMQAYHKKCMGCHQAMNLGPVSCRDCHAQTFTGKHGRVCWDHRIHARHMGEDCVRCHHQDTEAKNEGEYRSCSECHFPGAQMGVSMLTSIEEHDGIKHGECAACHLESNPEDDLRTCANCHHGMAPRKTEDAPCKEQAIHQKCQECHNRGYHDLRPSMPIGCGDCHQPEPSLIHMENSVPLMWSHNLHGEFSEDSCDVCHHKILENEPKMACGSCHGNELYSGIPKPDEALKTRCLSCHEEKDVGLTRWSQMLGTKTDLDLFIHKSDKGQFHWPHSFHAISLSLSCRDCHHNIIKMNGVTPLGAGKIESCVNCHGKDYPTPNSPAEGTDAPKLEEAMKITCIECHKRLGCGPLDWDGLYK